MHNAIFAMLHAMQAHPSPTTPKPWHKMSLPTKYCTVSSSLDVVCKAAPAFPTAHTHTQSGRISPFSLQQFRSAPCLRLRLGIFSCVSAPHYLSLLFLFFPSILSKHFPSKFLTHTSASALIRCSLSYSHFQESQQAASLSFYVLFLSSSHLRFASVPAVKAPPLLLLPTPPTSYFFPHTHFGCDDSVDMAKNTRVLKRVD